MTATPTLFSMPLFRRHGLLTLLASLLLAGCASIGPGTIDRDRFDYVDSLSSSWKRQTLLNLVKTRYADAPVFLDVASVISSYSLETELNFSAQQASPNRGDQFLNLGTSGRYADQPTISYSPLTGEKFARALMTPFPVATLLSLMQSGYRADIVLRICVMRINGLDNAYGSIGGARQGSAEFHELMGLFFAAQESGAIDWRVKVTDSGQRVVLTMRSPLTAEETRLQQRIRTLLNLDPNAGEFELVYGALATHKGEIAILPRSMQQVLVDFASYIEVPAADVAEGRVFQATRSATDLQRYPAPVRIVSGPEAPANAYTAVRYRNTSYWIDDRDVPSKAVFSFLMLMFSLTESGGGQGAPVLTIPAR